MISKEEAVAMAHASSMQMYPDWLHGADPNAVYRLVLAAYNKALDDAAAKCRAIGDSAGPVGPAYRCAQSIESMKE